MEALSKKSRRSWRLGKCVSSKFTSILVFNWEKKILTAIMFISSLQVFKNLKWDYLSVKWSQRSQKKRLWTDWRKLRRKLRKLTRLNFILRLQMTLSTKQSRALRSSWTLNNNQSNDRLIWYTSSLCLFEFFNCLLVISIKSYLVIVQQIIKLLSL